MCLVCVACCSCDLLCFFCSPPCGGVCANSSKDDKYIGMITKHADMLAAPPFSMLRACRALRDWVTGREAQMPLLDVSVCAVQLRPRSMSLRTATLQAAHAVALEPAMSVVRVVRGASAGDREPKCSAKAQVTYSMAAELVRHHGWDWDRAIAQSKQCWDRLGPAVARALANEGLGAGGGGLARDALSGDEAEPLTVHADDRRAL